MKTHRKTQSTGRKKDTGTPLKTSPTLIQKKVSVQWLEDNMSKEVRWVGDLRATDDFGSAILGTFYDAKTIVGAWAIMSPHSWIIYGNGQLGTGFGQKYEKQKDGIWLKVEG
jgi:hypothetical protein